MFRNFIRKNGSASLIVVLAVCFMIFGIFRGEIQTVWQKASVICLECIGIG